MIELPRRSRPDINADINIVPYIDVMLVLLVIFMMTTPIIEQGVEVIYLALQLVWLIIKSSSHLSFQLMLMETTLSIQ